MVMRNTPNNVHFDQNLRFFDSEFKLSTLSYNFLQTLTLNQFEVNEMCLGVLFDEARKIAQKIDSDGIYESNPCGTLSVYEKILRKPNLIS